jgi:hypothetical protein
LPPAGYLCGGGLSLYPVRSLEVSLKRRIDPTLLEGDPGVPDVVSEDFLARAPSHSPTFCPEPQVTV